MELEITGTIKSVKEFQSKNGKIWYNAVINFSTGSISINLETKENLELFETLVEKEINVTVILTGNVIKSYFTFVKLNG